MAVYLLKYDNPAGDPERPRCSARYYIGYARDVDLERRIEQHRRGTSKAKLPAWFARQGIGFKVVRVWEGRGRTFERRLKNAGHYDRHDPGAATT